MSGELLSTKMHVPAPRASAIPRPRLVERIGRRPVTLMSAPAGSGKTTAVAQWAMLRPDAVGWVSLEKADNDPVRFWSYVVAALPSHAPDVEEAALADLRSPQMPAIEATLTPLINKIAALPREIALVLEDYHNIESDEIHEGVLFLIEHLPPTLRLIITSRADPPLPLPRLRARNQLVEIRASDLRFSTDETSQLLDEDVGLHLSPEHMALLDARTEGWAVGLQLLALSLRGRADVAEFLDEFAGSSRYVLDYLMQEVLERQPVEVQDFLVRTSILDRLTGALCDTVTGGAGGQRMLEYLERANLFTTSLDEERSWYRYHYLFAESLRRLLRLHHPGELKELRRRAALWFARNGWIHDAIDQSLAGDDYETAADLIENVGEDMLWRRGRRITLVEWMNALPDKLVLNRPRLCLLHAWARYTTGNWSSVEPMLKSVERSIRSASDAASRIIAGEVAAIRSGIAYEKGEMQRSTEQARTALTLVPRRKATMRAVVAFQLGLASLCTDDLDVARASFQEAIELGRGENTTIALLALGCLAQLAVCQGRLRDALELYRQARRLGSADGSTVMAPTGLACVQAGEVFRERNALHEAERTLIEGITLCRQQGGMPEFVLEGYAVLARVRHAIGDAVGTREALSSFDEQAAQMRLRDGDALPIIAEALRHRCMLALDEGDMTAAVLGIEELGLRRDTSIGAMSRRGLFLLARVLLKQGKCEDAHALADRLLEASEGAAVVEPLIIKALAVASQEPLIAEQLVAQALPAAAREGYVRIFIDGGTVMRKLLASLVEHDEDNAPARQLLLAVVGPSSDSPPTDATAHARGAMEPYSDRELTILRLMSSGRSNQEIASELFLSVNTVKWYARNVYRKLGVSGRSKAVHRARELRLL